MPDRLTEFASWVNARLKRCRSIGGFMEARDEIEEVSYKVISGVEVDIKRKIQLLGEGETVKAKKRNAKHKRRAKKPAG